MNALDSIIPQRYWAWGSCVILAALCLALSPLTPIWLWPASLFALLSLVGLVDYTQDRQAIRRNYPVIAHFRFFFEFIRPEIRQYFIEADREELDRLSARQRNG